MSAAEFVQLVEQYPCIYNSDLPDYARKDTTEKAWQEVANEIDWTVSECKDKWKNIRNGYVRSLKPSFNGIPKKPYYLCEALQFILPYINPVTNIQVHSDKRRTKSPNAENNGNQYDDNEELQKLEEPDIEIEVSPQVIRPRVHRKARLKNLRKKPLSNDVDKAFVSWLHNKKPREDDPRKMFLLSLLPDVNKLSDEQLGVFRIKALLLLEQVKGQSGRGLQKLLDQ